MIDRYTRPALAELWSDARRYETWLRVELAACEAMEAAGRVPAGTAESVDDLMETAVKGGGASAGPGGAASKPAAAAQRGVQGRASAPN